MPTAWFTLSAADNYWSDLYKILFNVYTLRSTTSYLEMNEKQKLTFRVNIIQNYQHIVNQYFYSRVHLFLDAYFKSSNDLNINYY